MRVFGLVLLSVLGCNPELQPEPCEDAEPGVYGSSFYEVAGTCGPLLVTDASPLEPASWLTCADNLEPMRATCSTVRDLLCFTDNGQRVTVVAVTGADSGVLTVVNFGSDGAELCTSTYLVTYERH